MSDHYSRLDPQPIEVIERWGLDHHCASALAYIARAPHKGEAVRDLRKAIWYLNRRIQIIEAITDQAVPTPEPQA